jgi:hypothetical protein
MKKIQLIGAAAAICLLFGTMQANAQDDAIQEARRQAELNRRRSADVTQEGTHHVFVGYSFPNYIGNFIGLYHDERFIGPITAAYEYAIFDHATLGFQAAYSQGKSTKVMYMDSKGTHTLPIDYNVLALCLRGNYHFLENNKWDVYGGVLAGYGMALGTVINKEEVEITRELHSGVVWKINGGARYMFTPNIGLYAEAGYSSVLGLFSVGITTRWESKKRPEDRYSRY